MDVFAVLKIYVLIIVFLHLIEYFRVYLFKLRIKVAPLQAQSAAVWERLRKTFKIASVDGDDLLERKSIPDLISLLECFPFDAWEARSSIREGQYIVKLTGGLTDEDINRCRKLASCVQTLGYDCCEKDRQTPTKDRLGTSPSPVFELHPDVYETLESIGVLPLPNLRNYCVGSEMEFSTLNRVAGPNLSVLEFSSKGFKATTLSRQPEIVPLPLSLRALNFSDSGLPLDICNSLVHSFQDMHHLETISLPGCNILKGDQFRTLLTMKTVRKLDLGIMNADYLPFVPSESSQRLLHLHVSVYNLEHCSELLEKIGKAGTVLLQKLSVTLEIPEGVNMPPPRSALEEFFLKLSSLITTNSLEVVNVCFRSDNFDAYQVIKLVIQDPEYILAPSTIFPLFEFKYLKGVNICFKWKNDSVYDHSFKLKQGSIWSKGKSVTFVKNLEHPAMQGYGWKKVYRVKVSDTYDGKRFSCTSLEVVN